MFIDPEGYSNGETPRSKNIYGLNELVDLVKQSAENYYNLKDGGDVLDLMEDYEFL